MTEINEMTVVQANDLIRQTNWVMDKVPLKLFKALVAMIDTNNPPKDNTVTVSKKELVELLDEGGTNYDYLKFKIRKLQTSVRIADDKHNERYVSLVTDVYWGKDHDDISVKFHQDIMPFLIVTSRFLKYPAADLPRFKSKYGLILFEQLLSREHQYHSGQYIISVSELRWITGTDGVHKDFRNFEKKVIKTGIDDLNNAGVEILAKYRKIRKGHVISEIEFTVRKRTSYKEKSYEDVIHPSVLIENKEIPDEAADPERCPELEADQMSFDFDEEPGQFYNF